MHLYGTFLHTKNPAEESRVKKQHKTHKHLTNVTTMVAELPIPWSWGFDEPTLPKGQTALRIFCLRPPSKDYNRLIKVKKKLADL